MPSRTVLSSIRYGAKASEAYVCPSCLLRKNDRTGDRLLQTARLHSDASPQEATQLGTKRARVALRNIQSSPLPIKATRSVSHATLASSSAINPPSHIPAAFEDLHRKLAALQEAAGGFVDISRLQLALRSLETEDPTVRIALLGLGNNGAKAARMLAKVLLGDALGDEAEWERTLLGTVTEGKSVLLRYGELEDVAPQSPVVTTLLVPSPFLKRTGLEILITGFNTGTMVTMGESRELVDAMLVPSLTIPSAGGRVGFVRYPVHKALVVGEGVRGAVEYGRLALQDADRVMLDAALSLPLREGGGMKTADKTLAVNAIDIGLAGHALGLFRADNANGAKFSEEWEASGVSRIAQWLADSNATTPSGLKTAVANHITSTLDITQRHMDQAKSQQESIIQQTSIPNSKRDTLQTAVSEWSAEAHRDLQLNLTGALASSSWKRTAWFRLLWRIDDVSYSAADVLRRSWLNEAEQSLAFVSGRVQESGVASAEQLKESSSGSGNKLLNRGMAEEMRVYERVKHETESVAELMQMPTMLSRLQQQYGVNALFDPPWPQTINLARQQMLHTAVPALHRKAQALLVSTLTTIGGSAALGGWLWVASGGFALAEAGAIAAFGLVWSLRRLQKRWGKEREEFASTMREDGRRVLAEVEAHLRRIVGEGGRREVSIEDRRVWMEAGSALRASREALRQLS